MLMLKVMGFKFWGSEFTKIKIFHRRSYEPLICIYILDQRLILYRMVYKQTYFGIIGGEKFNKILEWDQVQQKLIKIFFSIL